jgi:hypothetical protein
MSSPDATGAAFYQRAAQAAAMKAALGTLPGTGAPARIVEGWPADTLTASDFPRMTFFTALSVIRRPGVLRVEIQADGWFWPDAGFAGERAAWTDAFLALFDEQHWARSGNRYYATVLPGSPRDFPTAPGSPWRRMIRLRIEASPGPVI